MLHYIFVVALLSMALGAPDPTKVCSPDQTQMSSFNIQTSVTMEIINDFKQKMRLTTSPTGSRIEDMDKLKHYIFDSNGNCRSDSLPPSAFSPQCLPDNSVYIGETFVGFGPNRLPVEIWETPASDGGTVKMFLGNQPGQPSEAILDSFIRDGVAIFSNFYFNQSVTITSPDPFKIPDPCPPTSHG
ncbi:unnamed protein product [Lymnaea stagnalis]|uniref:Uncharacterized protein n=1 Tax=Lymnaea stagnalis TaxID=6523 RepID=A0AAV2IGC8_LYMST